MLRLTLICLRVRFTMAANRLINPFNESVAGQALNPGIYGNYGLKVVFAVLGAVWVGLKRAFLHFLYVASLALLGMWLADVAAQGGYLAFFETAGGPGATDAIGQLFSFVEGAIERGRFPHYVIFVWLIFGFAGGFAGTAVTKELHNADDDIIINYFRADPAQYAKSRILVGLAGNTALNLPYLLALCALAGIPPWGALTASLAFAASRLFWEAVHLMTYRRTGSYIDLPPLAYFLEGAVFAAALVVPVYAPMPDWNALLTSPVTMVVSALLALSAWMYIGRYALYADFWNYKIRSVGVFMGKLKKAWKGSDTLLDFDDAKKWHEALDAQNLRPGGYEGKTGPAYLNAIFFDRHGAFFRKKLLTRCIAIFAPLAFCAAASLSVFFTTGRFGVIDDDNAPFGLGSWEAALAFAPLLFCAFFAASMGRTVTASVFANCDVHMLHYPYYRAKKNIFASFLSRFAATLRYNLAIAAAMSLSAIASMWFLYGHIDFVCARVLSALIFCLGVFFAFSDLFLYYVIQPYDSAQNTKSTIYKIIDGVIATFAVCTVGLRMDLADYSVFMFVVTALYLSIGVLLLLCFAPKRFRLRK